MFRLATIDDRSHFLRLWAQHMTEQEKEGSHVTANLANLYRCLDLFEGYAMGSLFGMTVLCQPPGLEPVGAVMAGELSVPDEFDTDLGKLATLWGVYVEPSHRGQGIGVKLFQEILQVGLEKGFDSVETHIRVKNEHGRRVAEAFGTAPYMQQHIASLRDPAILTNEQAQKALAREVSNG